MPYDYFIRVTHAYEKLRSLLSLWSMRCERMAVYEHVGTQTEKVHCHILIMGSCVHKKQLRNIGATCVNLKGNEMCSFKDADSNWETACVYMTKGKLDPKQLKGFEDGKANEWKTKWVEPDKVEKISTAQKSYNYFQSIVDEAFLDPEQFNPPNYVIEQGVQGVNLYKFNFVKRVARDISFQLNGALWTQKCANDYKMLLMSYCMRHGIPIPREHKFSDVL